MVTILLLSEDEGSIIEMRQAKHAPPVWELMLMPPVPMKPLDDTSEIETTLPYRWTFVRLPSVKPTDTICMYKAAGPPPPWFRENR